MGQTASDGSLDFFVSSTYVDQDGEMLLSREGFEQLCRERGINGAFKHAVNVVKCNMQPMSKLMDLLSIYGNDDTLDLYSLMNHAANGSFSVADQILQKLLDIGAINDSTQMRKLLSIRLSMFNPDSNTPLWSAVLSRLISVADDCGVDAIITSINRYDKARVKIFWSSGPEYIHTNGTRQVPDTEHGRQCVARLLRLGWQLDKYESVDGTATVVQCKHPSHEYHIADCWFCLLHKVAAQPWNERRHKYYPAVVRNQVVQLLLARDRLAQLKPTAPRMPDELIALIASFLHQFKVPPPPPPPRRFDHYGLYHGGAMEQLMMRGCLDFYLTGSTMTTTVSNTGDLMQRAYVRVDLPWTPRAATLSDGTPRKSGHWKYENTASPKFLKPAIKHAAIRPPTKQAFSKRDVKFSKYRR